MKANLFFHTGNELRVIGSRITGPSGARATVHVVHYHPGIGTLKVFLYVSQEESWEETWTLIKADGNEGGTFMRDQQGEFGSVEVALKKP